MRNKVFYGRINNRRYARNILIVFLVCGIWHGAGFNYMLWGLLHGGAVALYHFRSERWDRLPAVLRQLLTFTFVSVNWLLFQMPLGEVIVFFGSMVKGIGTSDGEWLSLGSILVLVVSGAIAHGFDPQEKREAVLNLPFWKTVLVGLILALGVVASFHMIDRSQSFIYFRF